MEVLGNYTLDTPGTVSGKERLCICIGGISCAIICQDIRFLDVLRARYQWFESSGPAAYEIVVRVVPFTEVTGNDVTKSTRPVVERVNSGDNFVIKWAHNPFVAVVNTSSKKVLAKMWDNQYCFDTFLRVFYGLILANEGGLLLHASAVSDGEHGSVFFGPSESGKTTVARLAGSRTVLTDELALIKPHNGGYRVYGTPFWGEFTPGKSNARAKLSGLYALKKAKANAIEPVDRVQAITALYRCVLFFSSDTVLLGRVLDTCCKLVDTVPVRALHFLPDPSFWQVVTEQT